MVKLLSEATPAKLNLFLRVVGRRSDGYHELDSIFLPIDLYDRLTVELQPSSSRSVVLTGNFGGLPADEGNLAVKAASCFMATIGLNAKVRIGLNKAIPSGAGLGGGSSDAGAVLRMMGALTRLGTADRLAELALQIGADVPFFLNPRTARVGGIGELITPLPDPPDWPLVVAVPPLEVSTSVIFKDLKPDNWSGSATAGEVTALLGGNPRPSLFVNDLEAPAIGRFPAIARLKARMKDSGACVAAMSGSGGAVFGLFDSVAQADRAADELRQRDPQLHVFRVRPYRQALALRAKLR
ncbi:MAG TPA: 4-(cytidine 5'-diphospho)-2-C-methyl-D-erythritol kinase [Candidatus Binataceae bacterium]|nr:4-(cytidine 5'-diphospho)-2-C-methyl-D-erythritol kinase [Candidatus Binataceae bacterium]